MHLSHLSLTHFRNYQRLELDLAGKLTLLQGQNAQGKTNLLEAIFFLATSKPVHAQAEREIVDWLAQSEPIPYCRVAGHVQSDGRPLELEILLSPRPDGANFAKQIKINGAPRRGLDLVGLMRAVLFLPEDIRLVDGAPGERRRYLDIALCQIDRSYCRALSAYQQVVTQRNSLLRNLRDQGANPHSPAVDAQLAFWDERLVQHGAVVVARRQAFLVELERTAEARHAELSGGREALALQYLSSFNPGNMAEHEYEQLREGLSNDVPREPLVVEAVAAAYQRKLAARRGTRDPVGDHDVRTPPRRLPFPGQRSRPAAVWQPRPAAQRRPGAQARRSPGDDRRHRLYSPAPLGRRHERAGCPAPHPAGAGVGRRRPGGPDDDRLGRLLARVSRPRRSC